MSPKLKFRVFADLVIASEVHQTDLDAQPAQIMTKRTARAWQYREDLREILGRKQINVVRVVRVVRVVGG